MNNAEYAITVDGLSKSYGSTRGIYKLSLEARPGEVFGLLGQNGAGKTTLIRLLMNFITPDSGTATVLGESPFRNTAALHRGIGYLPAPFNTYPNLTGRQLLNYFCAIRNAAAPFAGELIERFKFNPDRKVKHLSHGNIQKLGIIQAFMHRPPLIILDEPTTGLDPLMQNEFIGVAREAAQRGDCVFLSSHDLYEAQSVCHRVAIFRDGQVIESVDVEQLHSGTNKSLEVRFLEDVPPGAFEALPGVSNVSVEGNLLKCSVSGNMDHVIKHIAQFKVENLISRIPSIEEAFMHYYRDVEEVQNGDSADAVR